MSNDCGDTDENAVVPRDVLTGKQSGEAPVLQADYILEGYLITHPNGHKVRMDCDRTRAELYAMRNHATIRPMFVRR